MLNRKKTRKEELIHEYWVWAVDTGLVGRYHFPSAGRFFMTWYRYKLSLETYGGEC